MLSVVDIMLDNESQLGITLNWNHEVFFFFVFFPSNGDDILESEGQVQLRLIIC